MKRLMVIMAVCMGTAACVDETSEVGMPADTAGVADTGTGAAVQQPAGQEALVNPETASREELLEIPNIDETLADALIAGRPYTDMLAVDNILAGSLSEEQRADDHRPEQGHQFRPYVRQHDAWRRDDVPQVRGRCPQMNFLLTLQPQDRVAQFVGGDPDGRKRQRIADKRATAEASRLPRAKYASRAARRKCRPMNGVKAENTPIANPSAMAWGEPGNRAMRRHR